jgi:hypothetical protein
MRVASERQSQMALMSQVDADGFGARSHVINGVRVVLNFRGRCGDSRLEFKPL